MGSPEARRQLPVARRRPQDRSALAGRAGRTPRAADRASGQLHRRKQAQRARPPRGGGGGGAGRGCAGRLPAGAARAHIETSSGGPNSRQKLAESRRLSADADRATRDRYAPGARHRPRGPRGRADAGGHPGAAAGAHATAAGGDPERAGHRRSRRPGSSTPTPSAPVPRTAGSCAGRSTVESRRGPPRAAATGIRRLPAQPRREPLGASRIRQSSRRHHQPRAPWWCSTSSGRRLAGCPFTAVLSPDGRRVLTAGYRAAADVWRVPARVIRPPRGRALPMRGGRSGVHRHV